MYLLQVETVKNALREDFLYLTEVLLKKTIPHANKQLQDTLTKYFLENYVSDLLKEKMRKNNNRAVFQEIQATISSGRPKYLKLLNAFEDKIHFFLLDAQYNSMLLTLILDVGRHPRESEEWRTHTRKRMLSLLLYVHWNEQEKRDEFQSFFDMWKVAFPDNPLPQRQFKNQKIHTFDQKNIYSSQSLDDESLYNQQNNNNNNENPKTNNNLENDGNLEDIDSDHNKEVVRKPPFKKLKTQEPTHHHSDHHHHQNIPNPDPSQGNSFNYPFAGAQLQQQQQLHSQALRQPPVAVLNNPNPNQQQIFNFNQLNSGFTGSANLPLHNGNNNTLNNNNNNNHEPQQQYNQLPKQDMFGDSLNQLYQNQLGNPHGIPQNLPFFQYQKNQQYNNTNSTNNLDLLIVDGGFKPAIPKNNPNFHNNLMPSNTTNNDIIQGKSNSVKQEPVDDGPTENNRVAQFTEGNQLNSMNFDGTNNFSATNNMIFANNQNNPNFMSFSSNNNNNYQNFFPNSNNSHVQQQQSASGYFPAGFMGNSAVANPNNSSTIVAAMNMAQSYTNPFCQVQGVPSSLQQKVSSSDSQNYLGQHSDKLVDNKYGIDGSDNNLNNNNNNNHNNNNNNNPSDIFLAAQYYNNNPSQFNPLAASASAAVSLQNLSSASHLNQQNATQNGKQQTAQEGADNLQTNNPQTNNENQNILQNPNTNNNNMVQNENNNNNFQQVKQEQAQIKQQQSCLLSSLSMTQQRLLQSVTNDQLPMFYRPNFNMGSSGQNFNHFPQSYTLGNNNNHNINTANNNNNHSIFFTGSAQLGMGSSGSSNYIHQFFLQYYSELRDEQFNWESTEPISLYAKSQPTQSDGLEDLFRSSKKNISKGKNQGVIPGIIAEHKDKNNCNGHNNNNDVDEENDGEFSEIIESYEVEENPVSQ